MKSLSKFKKQLYISQRFLERSGTWTFQVQIRKNNISICKNFREKEFGSTRAAYDQAIAFRDKTVREIVNHEYMIKSNVTVKECYDESFKLFPVLYNTKNKIDIYFKNFESYYNIPIQKITVSDIQISLNSLIYKYPDDGIGRCYLVWERIIKTAVINRYIKNDFLDKIIKPKSQKIITRKERHQTTKSDLDTVIKLLKKSNINDYDKLMYERLLMILYYTGARPCEILALNKADIDLNKNVVMINKELGSSLDESGVIRKTKTPLSNRNIPISNDLLPILKQLLKSNQHEYLLCTIDGQYYKQKKICQKIGRLCKNKIDFNMYDLRHLFSTDLLNNGTDPKTHQELMGHSNYNMSLYYANSNENKKKEAVENR